MAESLGSAVLTVSVDDAQLKAGLDRARQTATSAGRAIGQALSGGSGIQTLNGLNIKLNSLQDELQKVAIGTRRFRELREEIEKTQRTLNRAQGGGGAGPIGNFASAVAGLGVGAGTIGFLRGSVNAAVELETITRKLSNTLGPQGAGQALSFTKGLSDQLGLSFKTLAGSFGSFTAAATAANVPLDQQKELFAAVSKAAQALGLSNDEINGSLLALQQVAAKGTVQMEELRGQLGERLPIAFGATARGLGITQQELIKLVESGRLTASQFFPALTKGLNELTEGAGGTATAAQNFQKLANAWDELQTSFGQSILPTVIEQVGQLTKVLDGIGVVLRANKLGLGGGAIGNALGIIPEQGAQAVGALRSLQDQYSLTEGQANALFTNAVASVGAGPNAFGQLTLSADQFKTVLEQLPSLAEQFRAKNKDTTSELLAQQAASAQLLALSKARADAETKILQPAVQKLAAAQQLQGLDGQSLESAKQRLAVEELVVKQRKAQADYDNAVRASGGNTQTPSVIEASAKLEAAGIAVKTAMIEGSEAARRNFEDAAKSLRQTSESNFKFLTKAAQKQVLDNAKRDIEVGVQAGNINPRFLNARRPDDVLAAANASRSQVEAIQNFQQAQRDYTGAVSKADQTINAVGSQLTDAANKIVALQGSLDGLASKDWSVNVSVTGDSAANVRVD